MKKIRHLAIILFLSISIGLHAQSNIGVQIHLPIDADVFSFHYDGLTWDSEITPLEISPFSAPSIMVIPNVYDYDALGMFCKFDVGLDKGSSIPLRFRLGTVGGVDEQERKGPTRYNY